MLRITVHDEPGALTFQLEGRLAGPWVRVMEECWQTTLAGRDKPTLRVDLTEVTSIDAAGRAHLEAMHREGAEFVAADCLTKAVVAEITGAPQPAPPPRATSSPSLHPKGGGLGLPSSNEEPHE